MKKRLKQIAWITVLKTIITILLLYITYTKTDLKLLREHLSKVNVLLFAAGYAMQNLSVILSSVRSRLYLKEYGANISAYNCLTLYYLGMFYNLILPSGIGGDGYKIYLLWIKERFPKWKALRVFFYERLNGLAALTFIVLFFALKSSLVERHWSIYPITIALLALLFPSYLLGACLIFRDRFRSACQCMPFSLLSQSTHTISALLVFYALDISNDHTILANYLLVILISSVVAILPITIGGCGIRELTFLYAAETLSIVDLNTGISFAICNYILYLTAGLTGGLFFYNLKKWKISNGTIEDAKCSSRSSFMA